MQRDALNRALGRFLSDKGYQQAPYTTSAELLSYIRAEAGPQHRQLIGDLFEKISFYDNRVEAVDAKKRGDGRYDVTLDLHATKHYADGKGKVLYLKRHGITTANPKVTVVVDEAPYEAGFDPYNKPIDRVSSDNRKRVTL